MTPKSSALCLDYEAFNTLSILQFVQSLKNHDTTHCVVAHKNELNGIISANHIAKRLKIDTHSIEHITFKYLFSLVSNT